MGRGGRVCGEDEGKMVTVSHSGEGYCVGVGGDGVWRWRRWGYD